MAEASLKPLSTAELAVVLQMRQSHRTGLAIYRYARSLDQPDEVDTDADPFVMGDLE